MGPASSKPDDQNLVEYLEKISNEEKSKLFDFIANNQEEQAIQLACKLINKERNGPRHGILGVLHVPEKQCKAYGVYMYTLLKEVYWHAKKHTADALSSTHMRQGVSKSPFWPYTKSTYYDLSQMRHAS
jgi:hypothetical protein